MLNRSINSKHKFRKQLQCRRRQMRPWKTAAECVKLQIFSPPAGCWMFPVFYCRIDLPGGVLLHWSWSGKTACHCWTGWRISSSTPYSESSHFSSTGCSVETKKKTQPRSLKLARKTKRIWLNIESTQQRRALQSPTAGAVSAVLIDRLVESDETKDFFLRCLCKMK